MGNIAGGIPQSYDNYYRDYFKTPKGKKIKNKAQYKFRHKLAKQYGTKPTVALRLHKEKLANERQRNAI